MRTSSGLACKRPPYTAVTGYVASSIPPCEGGARRREEGGKSRVDVTHFSGSVAGYCGVLVVDDKTVA